MARFIRRETPPQYSDHKKFKPFLRRDFRLQCAFCERTEEYLGGEEQFEIDHFKPERKFPELSVVYENLYYACRRCNGHKSWTWPSNDKIALGSVFADPCVEDPYDVHLHERLDGGLDELTPCGQYTNGHIRLDRAEVRAWRRQRRQARTDLPLLVALEGDLVRALDFGGIQFLDEIEAKLRALRRRIDESKLRFLIP
jgi:hypothetical protein